MEKKSYGIIYRLSFPNGNYIGQTKQGFTTRWKQHLKDTKNGSKLPVHNAIRKYYYETEEKNKIKYQVIETAYSLEELNNLEIKYINEYNTFNNNGNNPNGYNMTIGGDGSGGYKFTEEQREHCRKREEKRKQERPELSINHSNFMKQRANDNPNIGMQHSIIMKEMYVNDPSKRVYMSNLKKQQYKDNPDMVNQQSELKLMRYEDKDGVELISAISEKTQMQWKCPEKRKKIIDEKRDRFSKPFHVYKDGIFIKSFDYVPDCALELFGDARNSNISAVLKGKKKTHKGYTFIYK